MHIYDYVLTDVLMCTRAFTLCYWIDLVTVNLYCVPWTLDLL